MTRTSLDYNFLKRKGACPKALYYFEKVFGRKRKVAITHMNFQKLVDATWCPLTHGETWLYYLMDFVCPKLSETRGFDRLKIFRSIIPKGGTRRATNKNPGGANKKTSRSRRKA